MAGIVRLLIFLHGARISAFLDLDLDAGWGTDTILPRPFKLRCESEVHLEQFFTR